MTVQDIPAHLLPEFIKMLVKNQRPYHIMDGERENVLEPKPVKFARVKKLHCFRNHEEYSEIALKDEEHRRILLKCLKRRLKELSGIENVLIEPNEQACSYREFSDLFVDDEWRQKFEFVLKLLKPNYASPKNAPNLITAMRDKGKVPPNSHFQLFFITNKFLQMGAFKQTELTLSEICQKLYFSLRIDLDKSKFSKYYYQVLNESSFSGKQNVLVEEMDSILRKINVL